MENNKNRKQREVDESGVDIKTWISDLEAELSIAPPQKSWQILLSLRKSLLWLKVVSKVSIAGEVSVLLEL